MLLIVAFIMKPANPRSVRRVINPSAFI